MCSQNSHKYPLDHVFCPEIYVTREEAVDAAFETLEAVRAHGHYYK